MYVPCPKCGRDVWLEAQHQCPHCRAIIRRCVDCGHFVAGAAKCQELNIVINPREAEAPSLLSVSARCQSYSRSPQAPVSPASS